MDTSRSGAEDRLRWSISAFVGICVAVCCSALQCVASVLQRVAVCCCVLLCVALAFAWLLVHLAGRSLPSICQSCRSYIWWARGITVRDHLLGIMSSSWEYNTQERKKERKKVLHGVLYQFPLIYMKHDSFSWSMTYSYETWFTQMRHDSLLWDMTHTHLRMTDSHDISFITY